MGQRILNNAATITRQAAQLNATSDQHRLTILISVREFGVTIFRCLVVRVRVIATADVLVEWGI